MEDSNTCANLHNTLPAMKHNEICGGCFMDAGSTEEYDAGIVSGGNWYCSACRAIDDMQLETKTELPERKDWQRVSGTWPWNPDYQI